MKRTIIAFIINIKFLFFFIALALISSCDFTNEDSSSNLPNSVGIYKLNDASLSNWTDAYMNYISEEEASFMLIKDNADTAINVVCFANLSNGKFNHKVYFYLDSDYTVNALEIDNIFYIDNSSDTAPQYSFIGYDNNGNIVGEIISKKHTAPTNTAKSKSWNTAGAFKDIFNIIENTDNLNKGKYLDFGLSVGIDAAIGAVRLGAKWNLITSIIVEGGLYAYKEGTKSIEYGDITPQIYLKDSHTAKVTLNGTATEKSIFVGILIGTDPDRLFYNSNSAIKPAHVGDNIEFSIPELKLGTYYIKPFIISENICNKYKLESIREWFVRYGNIEKLKIPLIKVLAHEEIHDEYYGQYHETADQYLAKIKISVSIDDYEKATKWGVKISQGNKNGYAVELDNLYTFGDVSNYIFTYVGTFTKQDFINDDDNDDSSITLYASPYASDGINEIVCEGYKFTINIASDNRWVDLGLPSGTLWAKYNIGATSPEEYGGYYAWGEVTPKQKYTASNYLHYTKDNGEYSGSFIGNDISGTEYDAAHVNWGNGARMPNKLEAEELIKYCNWQSYTYNSVSGCLITGPNNNSIFLPFARAFYDDQLWNDPLDIAVFWTSQPYNYDRDTYATVCACAQDEGWQYGTGGEVKFLGLSIRAVKNK